MPLGQILFLGYDFIMKHTKLHVTTNLGPKLLGHELIIPVNYEGIKS